MTNPTDRIEIITSVRRRWTASEKVRMVGHRLGLVLSVHRARRLLALHPGLEALHDHVGRGCVGYVATGAEGVWLGSGQGSTSAAAAER
jgi:hypothetical protein